MTRFVTRARVTVNPDVLDDSAGTYRLPSGALFQVWRKDNRLLAGTRGYELLPQTTREFASNQNPAIITFERDEKGEVTSLNYQLAKRDLWINRIEENEAADPTILVDAGGHRIRMLVLGSGSPAIVIEDGFGSSIEMRSELQAKLSNLTRVITYDHAGTGGSEDGPLPRDAGRVAEELRLGLRNANVEPPFLLVGGSIGGDYVRIFADRFPEDVAGLVLLDPTPDWELLHDWMRANSPGDADFVRRIHDLTHASGDEMMKYQDSGRQNEWLALAVTRNQARGAFPSPEIPVTQILGAAGKDTHNMGRDKVRFFESWLKQHMPHAKQVLAMKSGHTIFYTEPQLVIREVRELVLANRTADDRLDSRIEE